MVTANSKVVKIGVAKNRLWYDPKNPANECFKRLLGYIGFDTRRIESEVPSKQELNGLIYEIYLIRAELIPYLVSNKKLNIGLTGLDMAVTSNQRLDVLKEYRKAGRASIVLAKRNSDNITIGDLLNSDKQTEMAVRREYMNIATDFFFFRDERTPRIKFFSAPGDEEYLLRLEYRVVLTLKQSGKTLKKVEGKEFYKIMNTYSVMITSKNYIPPEPFLKEFKIKNLDKRRKPIEEYMLYR